MPMTIVHRIEIPTPFALKRVNCYYIEDTVPTLVDTGVNTDECFETVSSAIRRAGGTIEGVKRIILTHAHSDHLGLVARIVGISRSEVFVHVQDGHRVMEQSEEDSERREKDFLAFFIRAGVPQSVVEKSMRSLAQRFSRFYSYCSHPRMLEGGESFTLDDFDLKVIHTPGHTPGSICLFNSRDGTLFSGDSLLEKITSNPMAEIGGAKEKGNYRSLEQYLVSLDVLNALPVTRVLPGHGPPFFNHRGRVKELHSHHQERIKEVLRILRENEDRYGKDQGMTQYMVADELFPTVDGVEIFLGLSEALGHLEILEDKGLVGTRQAGSQRRYHLR